MPLFASGRERRLWLWTLAVVVGIYATIGFGSTVAGVLREGGLIEASLFLGAMALVGATVVAQGLRARPGGVEVAVALGVAVVYVLVLMRVASPVERSHLIEYSVLAVFVYEALTERASQGRRVPSPALLAVFATALVGTVDECVQWLAPSRVFDPVDIVFNALAAVMAVLASRALGWARRRTSGATPG
ncbi:MAG: VanZ family protein [Chloroflexi bacterium]|nr:VanZ family protein [Chloroflexota bacterium]